MKSSSSLAVVLLLICVFSWGSVFPIAKLVLENMSNMSLVLWRFAIATVSLLLYMLIIRQAWPKMTIQQYVVVTIVSVIGVGGLNVALFTGLQLTQPTNGALIMALSPVVTSLLASAIAVSWPSRSQSFSLLVGLSGVLLVITNGSLSQLLSLHFNRGDLLIMCGMLAWSFYTLCTQRISQWMPLVPFTFMGMLAGSVTVGVICLLSPNLHPLNELLMLPSPSFYAVVYIGLFATVVGYLFWINGVKNLGPSKASLFFNFVPVFAAVTALTMGRSVSTLQVVGMGIVILGLTLPAIVKTRQRRPQLT